MSTLSKEEQRKQFRADEETRKRTEGQWPKYLMRWVPVEGRAEERKFLPFSDAAALYDSGFAQVDFGDLVLQEDMKVREMTDHDQHEISNAADEHSASK